MPSAVLLDGGGHDDIAALGLNVVGAVLGGNLVEDEADVDDDAGVDDDAAAAAVSVGGGADEDAEDEDVVVVVVDASAETCGPSMGTSMSTTPPPAVEPTGFAEVDRARLTRSLSEASPIRVT